jgi:hypothetical protein
MDKIMGDHQTEFWHNRWTTGWILCICQTLKKRKEKS